jgi:hypothetical protein
MHESLSGLARMEVAEVVEVFRRNARNKYDNS